MELLRWSRCDAHLPWARISRHRIERGAGARAMHRHDFAEWCWVESGVLQHISGGRSEDLRRGDARFLTPGAGHALAGGSDGGVLVTASIPGPLFASLARRYREHPAWPWPARGIAARRIDPAAFAGLVAGIPLEGQERCDAEWLIASLLRLLRQRRTPATAPPWLTAAVEALDEPRQLAAGLPALVRHCGRSPAHVSREVRRTFGCTATELVHRLRCTHAARELRLGTRPIATIAIGCGYNHLGHFYRRFAAVFGCTPRAYRRSALAS